MSTDGGSGSRRTSKRQAILAGTEQIMLTEGYGAVTFRSVATAAGVAPGLVQYYFPSLDDLFIAVLREATDHLIVDLTEATASGQPLRTVWAYANNPTGTALLMQFTASGQSLAATGLGDRGGRRARPPGPAPNPRRQLGRLSPRGHRTHARRPALPPVGDPTDDASGSLARHRDRTRRYPHPR